MSSARRVLHVSRLSMCTGQRHSSRQVERWEARDYSPLLSYRAGVMLTHARFCNGYVIVDSLMV
jgi:hypothetical protein